MLSRIIRTIAAASIAGLLLPVAASAQTDDWGDDWGDESTSPAVEIHGFAEAATSGRVTRDATSSTDYPLGEARLRLDIAHYADRSDAAFKVDFVRDALSDTNRFDIRVATLGVRVADWLDIRAGRQILTWGTGDLLFLNDLFPKDFQSFFVGRDDEFLKAPANAIKASAYFRALNIDIVWSPTFEPDRFISGEALSFFSPMAGARVGPDSPGTPVRPVVPVKTIENSEVYVRLHRSVASAEVAVYGYRGFTKEPIAFNTVAGLPTFARRNSVGASVRGNFAGGIANVEGVYYDSEDDRDGNNPFVPNSQTRLLAGYERELVRDFTVSLQYYAEWTSDYDSLVAHSPWPAWEAAEVYQLATGRVSWWVKQQTVLLSAFAFVSPNSGDSHWRLAASLKWSDNVTFVAGANLMYGDAWTFFGQLNDNSNAYMRMRYAF